MTQELVKTLVLIRHAHRDTTDRSKDNGLSEKGRRQAASLVRYFLKAFPPEEFAGRIRVLSSPKRRCTETVSAIAEQAEAPLEKSEELLEQRPGEGREQLKARAERFIEKWRAERISSGVTVVCSHGDWLPAALQAATGARAELKKGSWAEVRLDERGRPKLEWLIQSFKDRS